MNTELNSIKGKKVLVIGDVMLAVAYYAGFGDGWVFCMKQFVSDTQISEHLLHCVSVWSLPSRLTTYGEQPSPNRFLATLAAPPNTL